MARLTMLNNEPIPVRQLDEYNHGFTVNGKQYRCNDLKDVTWHDRYYGVHDYIDYYIGGTYPRAYVETLKSDKCDPMRLYDLVNVYVFL